MCRKQFFFVLGLMIVLLLLLLASAYADNSSTTTISISEILAPWLPFIVSTVSLFILALLSALTTFIKQRYGLEKDRTYNELERYARETLQSALTNASGGVIIALGDKLKDAKLDVHLPIIKDAVVNVNKRASDAVSHFKLDEDELAGMIIDKIGVMTATNAFAYPTTSKMYRHIPEQ